MFCKKVVPRQRSFPISDISSFGILSTDVDYRTPNPLDGTNQSEISNFGPLTKITAIFCEKAVPRQRSFPISDISSFGILSTCVDYFPPNPLVGPNQSKISNFWTITKIIAMFCEKTVPRQRSFPISDILSFRILSTSVHYFTKKTSCWHEPIWNFQFWTYYQHYSNVLWKSSAETA